jgi:hypothetical protein
VKRAQSGHRSPPIAWRLLYAQQQNGFHHEFESVDRVDRGPNRGLGNGLYGDDERHAVLGQMRFLLQRIDINVVAGNDFCRASYDASLITMPR